MNVNIGDRVRFLNAEGGGIITRRDGRTVFVEDADGFEIPALEKDVVVVTESQERRQRGSDYSEPAPKKQKNARPAAPGASWRERVAAEQEADDDEADDEPIMAPRATAHSGNGQTADEPQQTAERYSFDADAADDANPRFLLALLRSEGGNTGTLDLYAVNDSNCFASFALLRIDAHGLAQTICAQTIEPNTKVKVDVLNPMQVDGQTWRAQLIMYKKIRSFEPQPVYDVELKPKGTRMLKDGAFVDNDYFEEKALLMPVIKNDFERKMEQFSKADLRAATEGRREPAKKAAAQKGSKTPKSALAKGLLEVDLHIEELLEDTRGLDNKDMMEVQMNHVRSTMKDNAANHGLRIVFIHGVGAGVLKNEIRKFLERNYPKCAVQDASFREYGFGATMVTV